MRRTAVAHLLRGVVAAIVAIAFAPPAAAQAPSPAPTVALGYDCTGRSPTNNPNGLWDNGVVNCDTTAGCVHHWQSNHYTLVDTGSKKWEAWLIVPDNRKITGIEAQLPNTSIPTIVSAPLTHFWAAGWIGLDARLTQRNIDRPFAQRAMAINAQRYKGADCRTQDVLHIHLSCTEPHVAAVLRDTPPSADSWRTIRYNFNGIASNYDVIVVHHLDYPSPFELVYDHVKAMNAQIGETGIAVVGLHTGAWAVFAAPAAEDFLDETCGVPKPATP